MFSYRISPRYRGADISDCSRGPRVNTDLEWEKWGAKDPYFGVVTHAKFRRGAMDDAAKAEFFARGEAHVARMLDIRRETFGIETAPRRALDFGCGVGRLAIPLARVCGAATGVDVSPSMLEEARRNADAAGVDNLELLLSDDALSRVEGRFDFVHSYIVFQHIPTERGIAIFARMLDLLEPGGIGALHLNYAKAAWTERQGLAPEVPPGLRLRRRIRRALARLTAPKPDDPEMQMNCYAVNQLFWLLQRAGATDLRVMLEDHSGEYGAFLFFRKPAEA